MGFNCYLSSKFWNDIVSDLKYVFYLKVKCRMSKDVLLWIECFSCGYIKMNFCI